MTYRAFLTLLNAKCKSFVLCQEKNAIGVYPNDLEKLRGDFPDIGQFIIGAKKDPFGAKIILVRLDK